MFLSKSLYTFLLAAFLLGSAGFSKAEATDSVDEMTQSLNTSLSNLDWKEFGEIYAKYTKADPAYTGKVDGDELAIKVESAVRPMESFGKYWSNSVIRKDQCGSRIERVVSVFFYENGQVFTEYWFYRPGDVWMVASLNYKGHGDTGKLSHNLREFMTLNC